MVQQDEDVLAAVQRKRAEAKDTGYLADNAAQVVEEDDSGEITIKPADPQVVYVPAYDPEVVYLSRPTAQPYIAPVQNSDPIANPLVAGAIAFGAALLVQQLFGNDDDDDNRRWLGRLLVPRPADRLARPAVLPAPALGSRARTRTAVELGARPLLEPLRAALAPRQRGRAPRLQGGAPRRARLAGGR